MKKKWSLDLSSPVKKPTQSLLFPQCIRQKSIKEIKFIYFLDSFFLKAIAFRGVRPKGAEITPQIGLFCRIRHPALC
jgi:hypothetical protein